MSAESKARLFASYLTSLALFSLAAALVYFTVEMVAVSRHIPDILQRIDTTSEKADPVIDEVASIVEMLPPMLKEIEETRKLVPPILREVEQTRQQIPAILKEVEAVRHELPAVLASADKASAAVVSVAKEVEATRPLIPEVLKEVETTRESIPPMMDKADVLIEKARVAGKEASQGAVTGFFKGIITAPFALVGDVGRSIAGVSEEEGKMFSEQDYSLIEQASLDLLNNGSEGEVRKWENAESGNHGTIELTEIYTQDEFSDNDCRTLRIKSYKKDKVIRDVERSLCQNDDEQWEFDE